MDRAEIIRAVLQFAAETAWSAVTIPGATAHALYDSGREDSARAILHLRNQVEPCGCFNLGTKDRAGIIVLDGCPIHDMQDGSDEKQGDESQCPPEHAGAAKGSQSPGGIDREIQDVAE